MGAFSNATLLQVTPRLNEGGVERATVDISRAFVDAGGRSLVVSEGGRLEEELAQHGARLIRLPAASKNPFTIRRNADRLADLIDAAQVDIVHARSRAPAWSAYWAARRTGRAFVTTYHGIYSGSSGLKKTYNSVMARGDVVIANSEFTRRHVLDTYGLAPGRVVAIDRGVDLKRFAEPSAEQRAAMRRDWAVPPDGTIFLLPARLTGWKGHELAFDALRRVESPCILVVAGEGKAAYEKHLRAVAPPNVRFVGHVSDMGCAYAVADFVLVPSLDPEAFGRTAVEPQAAGRPVLAADHGAPSDTVDHGVTGWRVQPRDVQAWAEAMETACRTPADQRAAMGEAGRRRVRSRYSLELMASRTLEIYAGLLGDGAGRRREPKPDLSKRA